ncbi:MAG: DUF3631 domain-containing protein, partial [Pseudonocardia sp.]
RIRLLGDCHTAFDDQDALPTSVLLQRLKADPEAPWCDYGRDGLTAMKLAELLHDYDIGSHKIRFPGLGQAKGYYRGDFADAWARYCPQLPTAAPAEGGSLLSRTSLLTAGQPEEASQAEEAQASSTLRGEEPQASSRTQASSGLTWEKEAVEAEEASPHLRVIGGGQP